MSRQYLTNHFLIAMPRLEDPNFFHTVTYICEHNEEGALGIIVNRPTDLSLGDILKHMEIANPDPALDRVPVFQGGPVQVERGFVLHQPLGDWEATMAITDELGLTASQDILAGMAAGAGPTRYLVALGYAGWGAGQLEQELADNAWLSGPADHDILFEIPHQRRWQAAAARLGVDLNLISDDVGHA